MLCTFWHAGYGSLPAVYRCPPRRPISRPGRSEIGHRGGPVGGSTGGTAGCRVSPSRSFGFAGGNTRRAVRGPYAGLLCVLRTSHASGSGPWLELMTSSPRPTSPVYVQVLRLFGRDRLDLHQVERADEAVADAEAAGPGGIARRSGTARAVVLRQDQRAPLSRSGCPPARVQPSSSVNTRTPPSAASPRHPRARPPRRLLRPRSRGRSARRSCCRATIASSSDRLLRCSTSSSPSTSL